MATVSSCNTEDFSKFLAEDTPQSPDQSFEVFDRDGEPPLRVKVQARARGGAHNAPLIITFHGFVDQSKRSLPVFEGQHIARDLLDAATIVAISDSTLESSPTLKVGWYLGTDDFDLPARIASFLDTLAKTLAPSRMIFFGGSTGAHAALYHSRRFPGSLCLVANPLARVSAFHQDMIASVVRAGWPGRTPDQVFAEARCDDVGALYADGYDNRVLILQNATDHYFRTAVTGLLGALSSEAHFMLISEFFPNAIGHTYPAAPILAWTRAAVMAPTTEPVDVASALASPQHPVSPTPQTAPMGQTIAPAGGAASRDEIIAQMLARSA